MAELSSKSEIIKKLFIKYVEETIFLFLNLKRLPEKMSQNCFSCYFDHPSQRRHACLMNLRQEWIDGYFIDIIKKIEFYLVYHSYNAFKGTLLIKWNGKCCYSVWGSELIFRKPSLDRENAKSVIKIVKYIKTKYILLFSLKKLWVSVIPDHIYSEIPLFNC